MNWEKRCVEAVEDLRKRRMQVEVRDFTIALLTRELADADGSIRDLREQIAAAVTRERDACLEQVSETVGRLTRERDEAREALRSVEWSDHGGCPKCARFPYQGHASDCPIPRALGGG